MFFLLFIGIAYTALRSHTFQNKAIQLVVAKVAKDMDTKITLGKIEVGWWKKITFHNVLIYDQQGDTLIFAEQITAKYKSINTVSHTFNFSYLELVNGRVHFERLKGAAKPNYKFFVDYFKPKKKRDPSLPKVIWTIQSDKVFVNNSQFRYHDYNHAPPADRRFNEFFVELNSINGNVEEFTIIDDSLSFHINKLYTKDHSGFVVMGMQADARISYKALEFYNLNLNTPYSHITNQLVMRYDSYDDFEEFIDKVNLEASLVNSKVNLKDIAYFYEPWWGQDKIFTISGKSDGTISRLDVTDVDLRYKKNTKMTGNFDFSGLPDMNNALLDCNFKSLETNMTDFVDLAGIKNVNPDIYSLGDVKFSGSLIGFAHDFVTRGDWQTSLGNAKTDLKFNYNAKGDILDAAYKGNLKTDGFNLKPLLSSSGLGKFVGDITVDGHGLSLDKVDVKTTSDIKFIEFGNNKITNANIDGHLANKLFDGKISVNDPNLNVVFDGNVDLKKSTPTIVFDAKVEKANLTYFGLDTGYSILTADIKSNLQGNDIDDIIGNLDIAYLKLLKGKKVYTLENAFLTAEKSASARSLTLNSDIADVNLTGNFRLKNLPIALNNILWNIFPSFFEFENLKTPEIVEFDLDIKHPELILSYIPDYIKFLPSKLTGAYNSIDNSMNAFLQSKEIDVYDLRMIGLNLRIDKPKDEALTLSYAAIKTINGNVGITDLININAIAKDNILNLKLTAQSDSLQYLAKFDGDLFFSKDLIDIKVNQGGVNVHNRNWKLNEDGVFKWSENAITLEHLELTNANQALVLNGKISESADDKLLINFYNFVPSELLYDFGYLTKDTLEGVANGWIQLSNLYKTPLIESDFSYQNIIWNGDSLGNLQAIATNIGRDILKLDGTKITEGPLKGVNVNGTIDINKNNENYNLALELPKSNIAFVEQFMKGIVSNVSGYATGKNLKLTGKFDKPKLSGLLMLENASFLVDYLNTQYHIDKVDVAITEKAFKIAPTYLFDVNQNKGLLSGEVSHQSFDNWVFDININNIDKMQLLNTTKTQNELFYGTGYGSGNASFTGPLEGLDIYLNIKTEKGTKVTLPLEGEDAQANIPYIHFKKNEVAVGQRKAQKAFSNINSIIVELQATEEAEAEMVFDSKVGDVMRGNGKGDLKFELNKAADFYMYGTYEISQGSYLFTAFNFVNKPFTIEKGGTISWEGDPFDAKIKMTAIYKQKTTLVPLIDASQYSRQEDYDRVADALKNTIDVNSKIILTGLLFKPKIDFDIVFPNLQSQGAGSIEITQIKSRFANDAQELNKQFLSLLIFNRFLPVNINQIGTVVSSTPGQSASELLSSQLNNWVSDIGFGNLIDNISFDLGKNLGKDSGTYQTQLIINIEKVLYERIKFKGSIAANGSNSNATNYSLEYDITKDGNLKLRTNYTPFYYSNLYTNTNQQGLGGRRRGTVGVFYRREFETIWKKRKDR